MDRIRVDPAALNDAQAEAVTKDLFLRAAQSGDMLILTMVWGMGVITDIDCRDGAGWTALLRAVGNGHIDIAHFLLEHGASTESRTYQSLTPLHIASGTGNAEIVDLLCRFGADVNARTEAGMAFLLDASSTNPLNGDNGATPLDFAVANKDYAVVNVLVANGADVLHQHANGETVLWRACFSGDESLVSHVVVALDEVGATDTKRTLVNMARRDNWTPLNVAAARGYLKLVVFLIAHSADLETKNACGFSPLNTAANAGHVDIVECLLASGADTEAVELGGFTPLLSASKEGFEAVVDILLEHGAEINHRNLNGCSALIAATMEGNVAIVKSLLTHGADPNVRQNEGWTALLLAVDAGHIEVAEVLIDHGADINCQGDNHWTPLAITTLKGNTPACRMLLDRGALTNLQTAGGRTALHVAAGKDHQDMIHLLLDARADPNVRDFHGHTAAQVAMMEGYFTTAESLVTEFEYDDDMWPRHTLCELYGLTSSSDPETKTLRQDPRWYIDRSSIQVTPELVTEIPEVYAGTWNGSRVIVLAPAVSFGQHVDAEGDMKRHFREAVSELYPLRHPHLIKLYGACHRGGNPFLVSEYPDTGKLRSFIGEHRHRTWAILREIALGLQYLHERGIVHAHLCGDNIFMGDDGLIKLSVFGSYATSDESLDSLEWKAPEVVLNTIPSFESDVYSLGMCIIEAVSAESPYASEAADQQAVQELITRRVSPRKPAAMSTRGWELVMQMICYDRSKRLRISDVVRELTALAQDEALTRKGMSIERHDAAVIIDNCDVEETFAIVFALLNAKERTSEQETDTDTPQRQVLRRLHTIWQAVEHLPPPRTQVIVPQLNEILKRFANNLLAQADMGIAANFVIQRLHADHIFSFHTQIDRLLENHVELVQTHASKTTATIHSWRDQWYAYRQQQLQAFGASLARVESLDLETRTCLLFELTRRRDAYTPPMIHAACSTTELIDRVRVPD